MPTSAFEVLASLTICPRRSPAKVNQEIIETVIARGRTFRLPTVKVADHTEGRASNALYDHLQRIQ